MGNPSTIPPQREPLYPDRIPEDLKKISHWVVWRWKKDEKGKWTKPLYRTKDPDKLASHSSPTTWGTFQEALKAYESNQCHGIGFVVSAHPHATDNICGIDIDGCYDPKSKKITDPLALQFVQLANSYTEVSPSGTGIRVFGFVDPALKSLKGKRKSNLSKEIAYEIYFDNRYLTATGRTLALYTNPIRDITTEALKIYQMISDLKEVRNTASNNGASGHSNLSDDEILKRIRKSKQSSKFEKLFSGDWQSLNYPSQSEADFALCSIFAFWSNRDPETIDRIFRMSGLMREKWEREDYRNATIENAVAGVREVFREKQQEPIKEQHPYIEWAPSFLSIEDPPEKYKIPQLGPEASILLAHGEPRLLKTWFIQGLLLSVALQKAPFGMERFKPEGELRAWYASQEDGAKKSRARFKRLMLGMGLNKWPENLAFSIHKGINLDLPEWQDRLIEDAIKHNIDVLALDPIRRFSENVDKGPAEVRTLTAYLRRFAEETKALIIPVHHDVKPNGQKEDRRRGHKASGGDWFAASDCPIAFECAGKNKTLVIPEDYKFSEDPKAFTLELRDLENGGIQIIGKDTDAIEAKDLALQEKILNYLSKNPHSSGSAIQRGIKVRRDDLVVTLDKLFEAGRLDLVKKGNAKLWFVTEKKGES